MTFSVLLFITRKPTITPSDFKTYWDTTHIELLKSVGGEHFPISHTRHYIARPTEVAGSWPAAVLVGTQDDFTYDGIAELVFKDEDGFKAFFGLVSAPDAAARIAADEDKFTVREKMKAVVVGGSSITSGL
ncbi:hypothetical protein P154DRAFT_522159 [Amniculicola lignicola CBS 123094]|uniref:EthD domain-containing protein n=1 Tax=Amniculicola lignicola CBS 123094 TaxID=1392246 RepID=A0A6A5WIX3_9PLEO|nr:hypothetical protein P154DRAFT_522159 [Amniculicola lignicola CBS 123094]